MRSLSLLRQALPIRAIHEGSVRVLLHLLRRIKHEPVQSAHLRSRALRVERIVLIGLGGRGLFGAELSILTLDERNVSVQLCIDFDTSDVLFSLASVLARGNDLQDARTLVQRR